MNSEILNFINGLALIFILLYLAISAVALIIGILQIIALWILFEKAGEKGWKSLIPVYNYFVMIKTATGNYNLAWIYTGIQAIYIIISAVSGFITAYGNSDIGAIAYVLLMLMSLALIIPVCIIAGYTSYMFGKSFGKSTVWNVCMIFFSPILIIAMGFDKNTKYIGANGIPQNF